MSKYKFIDLDKSQEATLKKHLKEACGVEPAADATREALVEAIMVFEENNELLRPQELLPKEMRTDLVESAEATINTEEVHVPIAARPKVRVIITVNGEAHKKTQEYFMLNEWNAIIKFGEEVDIPKPVYDMIRQAKEVHYDQEKDGTITPRDRKSVV